MFYFSRLVAFVEKSIAVPSYSILVRNCKYFSAKTDSSITKDELLISDSCVQKLKQLCDGNDKFLRLCVESGGCSGFQYKFDLDSKLAEDDR